ncbi:MarR family winged helix-turn-helix transcriptional regulator [Kutzneria kofuensis]|uniref:DNA-binding MarR family transcriptional regulator n=1 Tax=Kutzneria kofuensis TaxID=103725 RepID=A0A7W9NH37_9PSEU|nr:helix-turn-helix domain-containing protein [Kutzneria kofuensis]MBB5892325.1 DNA-binding MarR family transcriptional regulator [Kutzneria kofuensis]
MDGVRLHRLGKRLIDLARQVTTDAGDTALTPGEVAVLEDVLKHPGSVVTEIQARTGFAQSHVSASVSRLREQGLIVAAPDPEDRRRTRLTLADIAHRAIMRRAGRPADDTIAEVVGTEKAERVLRLLEELSVLLD